MSKSETQSREGSASDRYDVYLYNLPKVDQHGKSISIAPAERREFTALDEARTFAAEHKGVFDRIVLFRTTDEVQQLVERFRDGELQA